MSNHIAQLPMYDWPEVRAATDALWGEIHTALQKRGIASPDTLDREEATETTWLSPRLLLSQTCGLPLVQDLRDQVTVLGRFTYQNLSATGDYHSVIVVRRSDSINLPEDLRGQRAAINHEDSYSGCLTLKRWASRLAGETAFFASIIATGSHRDSVCAVANGLADTAAIDHVSWCLAKRVEPTAQRLSVVAKTDDRPGLPLITQTGHDTKTIASFHSALDEAVTTLDPASRSTLGITGFVPAYVHDYDVIDNDLQQFGTTALC
jgi:ABC-type phosphate/phosphonate transport system substrate-binding protein